MGTNGGSPNKVPASKFAPIYIEDEGSVQRRILDPFAQQVDPGRRFNVAEGGFLYDLIEPMVLEFVRVYEQLNIIAGISYIVGAEEEYLNQRGIELDLPRKLAQPATVTLTIEGEVDTVIPVETAFTTPTAGGEDEEAIDFATLADATIPAAGIITVDCEATVPGAAGNVARQSITQMVDVIDGIIAVSNAVGAAGGADEESDDVYRGRLLEALRSSPGAGNVSDYKVWATEIGGVEEAAVFPLWDGPGTVRVVVFGSNRTIPPAPIVKEVQAYIDPSVVTLASFDVAEAWSGGIYNETFKDEGNTSLQFDVLASGTTPAEANLPINLTGMATADKWSIWLYFVSGQANCTRVRVKVIDTNAAEAYYDALPAFTAGAQTRTWTTSLMVVPGGFLWSAIARVKVEVTASGGGAVVALVDTLRFRDADGGRGQGQAPIGAQVTVSAPRSRLFDVSVAVIPELGHTVASLAISIEANIVEYLKVRDASTGKLYIAEIANVIHDTHGVENYSTLLIDGGTADITLDQVEVPILDDLTVT